MLQDTPPHASACNPDTATHPHRLIHPTGGVDFPTRNYPVVNGLRTKESSDPATEAVYARVTKSSLTSTRVSTLYTEAKLQAGFGADVSFQTQSADGVVDELGTCGFSHTGDGGAAADFLIKAWCVLGGGRAR